MQAMVGVLLGRGDFLARELAGGDRIIAFDPVATSPSAIPLTSSGCSRQNSAIWSKVREVFSTSQTAVALGINGASLMNEKLLDDRLSARSGFRPRASAASKDQT